MREGKKKPNPFSASEKFYQNISRNGSSKTIKTILANTFQITGKQKEINSIYKPVMYFQLKVMHVNSLAALSIYSHDSSFAVREMMEKSYSHLKCVALTSNQTSLAFASVLNNYKRHLLKEMQ